MGVFQSKQAKLKDYLENQVLTSMYPPPTATLIKTRSRKPIKKRPQNAQRISLHARPSQGSIEKVVNKPDLRKQVLKTDEWPSSVHGVVSTHFDLNGQKISCWGTGTLIGPNIVLTAGHNLYDVDKKIYANLKSIKFLPGMNGELLPFGVATVKKYFVSPDYIKEGREDYGILILKESIGDMTGYFGLACLEPEEIKKKKINITGYPGDKVAQKPTMYEMWGMEGSVSDIDISQGQIHYMIDTYGGQSGSGIWYKEGNDFIVCGIHVLGSDIVNTGTLLTRRNYQQIHSWINQATLKEHLSLREDRKELTLWEFELDIKCLTMLMVYNLENLGILDISYRKIGAEGAKELARNTSWVNLSELILSENNIGAEGAKALAQNTSWINLSKLNLNKNNIGLEGAKALAQNTSWVSLSEISLSKNNIGAEGAKELAQNTSWVNLSKLNLSWNDIGAEGAKALAQNVSWINLSNLNLSGNQIGAEGARALALNTSWTNLSRVFFPENNIGAEGARVLAQKTSWVNLLEIDLSRNNIGADGARALAQNTSWVNLSEIYLSRNNIGVEGAKALAKNTSWVKLSQLSLCKNTIGPEGARALAQNTSWRRLSKLDLSTNNIGSEEVKAFSRNPYWQSLILYS